MCANAPSVQEARGRSWVLSHGEASLRPVNLYRANILIEAFSLAKKPLRRVKFNLFVKGTLKLRI